MLNELNEEQRRAVLSDGNVLLSACPGSGKTRVVSHKIAYELSRLSSSKKRVIAVTFTNRAADEIYKRVDKLGVDTKQLWVGTIHAFCLDWIIRPYSSYLDKLKNGFSVVDEVYASNILSVLQKKYEIEYFDDACLRINRDGSLNGDRAHRNLANEFYTTLLREKLIDFNLMLFYAYKLLKNNEFIPKSVSNVLSFICVDEYQDTQDLQYAIIAELLVNGSGCTRVFYTGDIDQAIYTSLGGIAKSHNEIQEEIGAPLLEMSLSGNYRSNQRIIDYYRCFQTSNIGIEALGGNKGNRGVITFNQTIHKDEITTEISRLIQASLFDGCAEDDICILVPQWWMVISIAKELRAALPDVSFDASGLAPMSKHRSNIWYKISRFFLTEASPKLLSVRYRWAEEVAIEFELLIGKEVFDAERKSRSLLKVVNSITSERQDGVEYIQECLDKFACALHVGLENFPKLKEMRELYFCALEDRLNAPEIDHARDTETFKKYYREMSGVVINTCVGIKGEEFDTVIAYGLLKGYVPHWNDVFAHREVESSKKLLYVICSRAKEKLHLISEVGRTVKSSGNPYQTNPQLKSVVYDYDESGF